MDSLSVSFESDLRRFDELVPDVQHFMDLNALVTAVLTLAQQNGVKAIDLVQAFVVPLCTESSFSGQDDQVIDVRELLLKRWCSSMREAVEAIIVCGAASEISLTLNSKTPLVQQEIASSRVKQLLRFLSSMVQQGVIGGAQVMRSLPSVADLDVTAKLPAGILQELLSLVNMMSPTAESTALLHNLSEQLAAKLQN